MLFHLSLPIIGSLPRDQVYCRQMFAEDAVSHVPSNNKQRKLKKKCEVIEGPSNSNKIFSLSVK